AKRSNQPPQAPVFPRSMPKHHSTPATSKDRGESGPPAMSEHKPALLRTGSVLALSLPTANAKGCRRERRESCQRPPFSYDSLLPNSTALGTGFAGTERI